MSDDFASTDSRVAAYLARPYSRVFEPAHEGGFTVSILELPGCVSEGDTFEQAWTNLDEALAGVIACMLAAGQPIPPPVAESDEPYPGLLIARVTPATHEAAARRARADGVSLNDVIARAVAAYTASDAPSARTLALGESPDGYDPADS